MEEVSVAKPVEESGKSPASDSSAVSDGGSTRLTPAFLWGTDCVIQRLA